MLASDFPFACLASSLLDRDKVVEGPLRELEGDMDLSERVRKLPKDSIELLGSDSSVCILSVPVLVLDRVAKQE